MAASPTGPDDLYRSPPPWDIGRPQPTLRALADAGAIRGHVLDAGCGTGEHVLMCAGPGLDATGVDLAAEEKARDRGLLFHIFSDEDRAAYVDSLRSVLGPDGRFFMLCFNDRQPAGDAWLTAMTRS